MIFVKLLVGILALPLIIGAYIVRFFFYLVTLIGTMIANLAGGLLVVIGIILALTGDFNTGIGSIAVGAALFAAPYVSGFVVGLVDIFIDIIKGFVFGR